MEVKVGQVWADNDSRIKGEPRLVLVETVIGFWAIVKRIDIPNGRKSTIRLERFKPTANGYRLVQEPEARA